MRHPVRDFSDRCADVPHRWHPCPGTGNWFCTRCGKTSYETSQAARDKNLLDDKIAAYERMVEREEGDEFAGRV